MLEDYLKICVYTVLRYVPGRFGRNMARRFYWARQRILGRGTQEAFDRYLNALTNTSVCIDLGANVGEVTDVILRQGARVYAFEPDPWAFDQLRKRIGNNPKAVFFNSAIGDHDGSITLARDPAFDSNREMRSQGTSAYRSSCMWGPGDPDCFSVPLIDICRFIREESGPVDLLKMDIEGAEVDVLERLLSSPEKDMVKAIFVETHEAQIAELRKRTRALRRRIRKIKHPMIFPDWH